MSKKILFLVWVFVEKIDAVVNHGIVDCIFNMFPVKNKDGSDHISFKIWKATSRRFCEWWNIDVHDAWFGTK